MELMLCTRPENPQLELSRPGRRLLSTRLLISLPTLRRGRIKRQCLGVGGSIPQHYPGPLSLVLLIPGRVELAYLRVAASVRGALLRTIGPTTAGIRSGASRVGGPATVLSSVISSGCKEGGC